MTNDSVDSAFASSTSWIEMFSLLTGLGRPSSASKTTTFSKYDDATKSLSTSIKVNGENYCTKAE